MLLVLRPLGAKKKQNVPPAGVRKKQTTGFIPPGGRSPETASPREAGARTRGGVPPPGDVPRRPPGGRFLFCWAPWGPYMAPEGPHGALPGPKLAFGPVAPLLRKGATGPKQALKSDKNIHIL